MATVTITIPDPVLSRVVAAYGTQAALKADLINHIKSKVASAEQQAAVATIDADIQNALGLT